jgi:transcriptional regulator with XRE-family HTH domain
MKFYDVYGKNNINPTCVKEVRNHLKFYLGDQIRRIRKAHHETLDELANELNIDKTTLSKYENATIEMPSTLVPLIAARYNISISELYGEEKFSQLEDLRMMIRDILNIKGDITLDYNYFENILIKYFYSYFDTDQPRAFDMYYTFSVFLEQVDLYFDEQNSINFESKKNEILNNFLLQIYRILHNNYKINRSVYNISDLINILSDNKMRTWDDYDFL